MRHLWSLPEMPLALFAVGPAMRVVEELIVQDGPILTFMQDPNGQFYLALAIDRDRGLTRWVQAPISTTQHSALLQGGLPVRDAIIAPPKVHLVDYQNTTNTPLRAWEVEPSVIPESCLPERGAFLPSSVRREHAAELAKRTTLQWHLAGEDITDDITFGKVSAATKTLQRLVTALCEWRHVPILQLRAAALRPGGSMVIEVKGIDNESFSQMVGQYQRLVFATYDKDGLHHALMESSRQVADSYGEYLKFVDLNRVEVLAEWPNGSAYVGYGGAKQARSEITSVKLEMAEQVPTRLVTLRGFFEGFTIGSGRFEFYDLTDAQTYVGRVASGLQEQIATDSRFSMTLGKETQKYDVTIELAMPPRKRSPKCTLMRYSEVPEEPHLPSTGQGPTAPR